MADAEIKMVVVDGVRYREEHAPAPKSDTKAQPVEDDGAEVEQKMRAPRKSARTLRSGE